jgi:hypothetical protein
MSGCVAPMCCPRSGPCGASGRVRAPLPLDLQAWPDYANGFDPNAMLGWLGWQPEQLKAAAYQLLGHASSIDPQQRWHPHPPVGLLGPRAAGAQHDEVVGVPHQHPELAAASRPFRIQHVERDVGQQRRDDSSHATDNPGWVRGL